MSDSTTKRLLKVYIQSAPPTIFFSGLCATPPENFFASEKVLIDIVRYGEDVAVVIQDLSVGYRYSSGDAYTNKEFLPPIYQEANPLNSFDLIKRPPGSNPFEDIDYRANLMWRMFHSFRETERKIRRSIEWQASQVLQTGKVILTNEKGKSLYVLDYKPKVTHFPTVTVAWDQATATPIKDISDLAEIIRNDGLSDPDQLIMGINAFESFLKNEEVAKRFDNRNYGLGSIEPMQKRGQGGTYRGVVDIGEYKYEMFTYGGTYNDPETGNSKKYLSPNNVILRASNGRLDLSFGAVPNIGKIMGTQANVILQELPGRITNSEGGMDLFTNAWLSPDGSQLFCGVACRPIVIPTAIDTYGCLNTKP